MTIIRLVDDCQGAVLVHCVGDAFASSKRIVLVISKSDDFVNLLSSCLLELNYDLSQKQEFSLYLFQ